LYLPLEATVKHVDEADVRIVVAKLLAADAVLVTHHLQKLGADYRRASEEIARRPEIRGR
jgi:hypothetical protein